MKTATTGSSADLPGPIYCDASALVKLYVPEAESDALNRRIEGRRDLLVSDLSVTEIVSSLSRRRREGTLKTEIVSRLHRAILGHLEDGVYRKVDLIATTHREAERLLLSVDAVPLRAADALHLALAIAGDAACLLTFDRRLALAAQAVGLRVLD